ncbi:MAG: DUF1127 domain-containing protein [Pseudomonadota bacterium]
MTGIVRTAPRYAGSAVTPGLVSRLLTALSIWRERTHLNQLDAHLLRDIGYDRKAADLESRRSVWDAPERWQR